MTNLGTTRHVPDRWKRHLRASFALVLAVATLTIPTTAATAATGDIVKHVLAALPPSSSGGAPCDGSTPAIEAVAGYLYVVCGLDTTLFIIDPADGRLVKQYSIGSFEGGPTSNLTWDPTRGGFWMCTDSGGDLPGYDGEAVGLLAIDNKTNAIFTKKFPAPYWGCQKGIAYDVDTDTLTFGQYRPVLDPETQTYSFRGSVLRTKPDGEELSTVDLGSISPASVDYIDRNVTVLDSRTRDVLAVDSVGRTTTMTNLSVLPESNPYLRARSFACDDVTFAGDGKVVVWTSTAPVGKKFLGDLYAIEIDAASCGVPAMAFPPGLEPDGDPGGVVSVVAVTHVVVNSFDVTDDEQTLTYDFDFFLDDFPQPCGACRVRVFDGAGKLVGDASITEGGYAHFSGTDTIGGSTEYTPEGISQFFALVSLSVGDPATTYGSQFIPIDFGWQSPSATGTMDVAKWYESFGRYYYEIAVDTYSLGGDYNEVCGYLPPDARCRVEVSILYPDGSRSVRSSAAVDAFGHQVTTLSNIGTAYGINVANFLAGTQIVVEVHGESGSEPSRYLRVGTLDFPAATDLPLIIAHGITGTAAGEATLAGHVRASVPSLVAPGRIVLTETTKLGSVWSNSQILANDARELRQEFGVPAVNVLAHSKGGLDARAASFFNPGLINTIGMLSTPNGGSAGADTLCALRHIPSWEPLLNYLGDNAALPEQGACDSEVDGLYNLQTFYVQDTFNKTVRDDSSKRYFDVAGSCLTNGLGCLALDVLASRCSLPENGDMVVCVSSAFWLASNYRRAGAPGGKHVALEPLFPLQHSGMNTDSCPTLRLLSRMYRETSTNNPWIDGGGPACSGYSIGLNASARDASGSPSATQLMANVRSFSFAAPAAVVTPEPPSATTPAPMNRQAIVAASSSPDAPFTMTLDPEGLDTMGVLVFLLDGAQPAIRVLDSDGNDTGATVAWLDAEDALGVPQAEVLLSGLAAQQRTLEIVSAEPLTVGVETLVSGPTALATSVEPGTLPGTAVVTAELIHASEQTRASTAVTAYFTDASGETQAVPLMRDATSGEFTATLTLPSEPSVPIGIIASGPTLHRYAMTGIALPDGTGQIGVVDGDTLVDLDADGSPDAMRLPVSVDVTVPGDYTLVLDAVDSDGATASAAGSATLSAGAGVIIVDMPLDRLITAGASGTLSLVNGLLLRGLNPQKVATSSDLGSSSVYDASTVVPTQPVLSRFAASARDEDGDSFDDTATFAGRISVPAAGSYELTARFEAPDGTFVEVDDIVALGEGMNAYSLELALDVASHGTGTYALGGVLLTGLDDTTLWAFGHDASVQIGPAPLPNEEPVALATLEQHGATVTVDGAESYDPDGDIVETAFDFGDGTIVFGTTATHTYAEAGDVKITMWVRDDEGAYDFVNVGTTLTIPDYEFGGFKRLVGKAPAQDHGVAGLPIYLGFSLGKDWGNDIMAVGSPTVQQVSCTTGEALGDPTSAVGPNGRLPVYTRWTHRYVWTWYTDRAWAGTCQELTLDFNDGSSASHVVEFAPKHQGRGWWFRPYSYWETVDRHPFSH